MFAQNIDLLHNLTEKEIDGLSVSVPTIQMSLNPGKPTDCKIYSFQISFFRININRYMYGCKMFFE